MIRITGLFLIGLLAGCSLPLGTGTSSSASNSDRPAGTASLTLSTPYGSARAVQALQAVQGTVEPENLGQLFDHVTVVLDSLAQPNVTKTVPAGQASLIRLDGLYEASDWTLAVTAYNASNAPVAQFLWNQGGLSTLKGRVTTLGDIFLNPVPGPGTSAFQLDVIDLPSELHPESTTWTLEPLNTDGTLGVALTAGDLAKVSAVWTGRQLTVKTLPGQELPTGSYRLTLNFQTLSGQALSLAPVFVVNLYPGLTSTKTFSGSVWPAPLAALGITFPPQADKTSNAGIVVTWQPDDPTPVVGYEYLLIPATTPLPDVSTFDATFFTRPGTRSGFLAASAMSRFRPSWLLPADDIPAAQLVSSDWGFYVRAVTTTGTKGPWAASTVAVDVSFNVALNTVTVAGSLKGRYELRRIGSSVQYPTSIAEGFIHPEIDTFPVLSRFAFEVGDPSTGPQIQVLLPEPWILAPGQQLILETPDRTVPVEIWFNRTLPNQAPFDLSLYDSYLDENPLKARYLAFSAPLPTMAGPGLDWSFRMASATILEGLVTSDAISPVSDPGFGVADTRAQIVPLNYQGISSSYIPDLNQAKIVTPDTWTPMNWTGGNEAMTSRSVVARPVWVFSGGPVLFGAWSPLGMTPGTSVAPTNVFVDINTNLLTWDAVDDSTWGAAQVTGYVVDKVGGYPGLPITLAPEVQTLNVSSYGIGDYTVATAFQRPDGRTGVSAPTQWPNLVALPSSVLSDLGDRRPGDANYDATQTRGRFYDVSPDLYRPGAWLASGLAGSEGDVMVTRHLGSGLLDTDFGHLLGPITRGIFYVPNGIFGGSYFDNSIGLTQSESTGQILINSYVQPGGGGYTRYSAYSFQGVEDLPNFNSGTGFVQRGPNRLPVGRLVRTGTNSFGLENLEPGYGVVRIADGTGSLTASGVLTTSSLHRIAVKDSSTLLAIGDAGLVLRISATFLNLDGATDSTIWTGDGIATINFTVPVEGIVAPHWKDIAIDGLGRIVLTGWVGTDGYVVRLQTNGSLDTSFSGTGWVKLPGLFPQDLAVNTSHGIVVTGDFTAIETDTSLAFLKGFSASGTPNAWLDKTLQGTTGHGASARAVAYNSAGRLMVAGFTRNSSNLQDTLPALWSF